MKLKYYLFIPVLALIASQIPILQTQASTCSDVIFVFARGSGSNLGATNYQTYRNAIVNTLTDTTLSYDFYELGTDAYGGVSYPAAAVGAENFSNFTTALGAYVGSGNSYMYGKSIAAGISELVAYTADVHSSCPNAKFVLAGYSQGAQVVSSALPRLNQNLIIYAATFGDPKLYLPEGKGIIPDACRGVNLSAYRAYVPDCKAYQGILGGTNPYQPVSYANGKVGAWCIYHDIMCSAYIDLADPITTHLNYKADGMYASAANVIYSKLVSTYPAAFATSDTPSSYDSVLMFDATGSMSPNIKEYKSHALEIIQRIFADDGRLSLYEYRDLVDKSPFYSIKNRCDFSTCTPSVIEKYIQQINTTGGGDTPESLLHALKTALNESSWQNGAKKSIIVLTDAGFHNPDLDDTTMEEVIALARSIDPVHIYIVAPGELRAEYDALVSGTGGAFFALESATDLGISEDVITSNLIVPTNLNEPDASVTDATMESISSSSVKINFSTDAARVYVALNDTILGYTTATEFTLTEIDPLVENTISLIPYSVTGKKGITTNLSLKFIPDNPSDIEDQEETDIPDITPTILVPKTGEF